MIQPPTAEEAVRHFEEAEQRLKDLERRYHRELLVPAINQLRYAGKHFSRILAGVGDKDDELRDAIKHCKRAIYDASELEIIFLCEDFDEFQDTYKKLVITENILPGYNLIVQQFDEAIDYIGQIDGDGREDYYSQCASHVAILRQSYKKAKAARQPLNALIAKQQKINISLLLAVVGTIAAVVSAVVDLK
jgi:hypothetical protein